MASRHPDQMMKVSFLIKAPLVGDFLHAFADQIEALEVGAVHRVPYNKNKPAGMRGKDITARPPRSERLAMAKAARNDVLSFLKGKEIPAEKVIAKLAKHGMDKQNLYALLSRMKSEGLLAKTDIGYALPKAKKALPLHSKLGDVANRLAPAPKKKKPRPPGGFNFENPAIRNKAVAASLEQKKTAGRKAAETAKKNGVDFSALGRKGSEAKKLKQQQARDGNASAPAPAEA